MFLILFLYLVYSILMLSKIFIYIFVLLILLGVYYDTRIKGWRYLLIMIFIMIHFIILKEGLIDIEVLLIKDLFWYSFLMLISFL